MDQRKEEHQSPDSCDQVLFLISLTPDLAREHVSASGEQVFMQLFLVHSILSGTDKITENMPFRHEISSRCSYLLTLLSAQLTCRTRSTCAAQANLTCRVTQQSWAVATDLTIIIKNNECVQSVYLMAFTCSILQGASLVAQQ